MRATDTQTDQPISPPRRTPPWLILAGLVALALISASVGWVVASNRQEAESLSTPRPPAQGDGERIDVKSRGAKGDGQTDDTRAIKTTMDNAPAGANIYFPEGTYVVRTLFLTGRKDLSLTGAGRNSLLKRQSGEALAVFRNLENFRIANLAFDANGLDRYGGLQFLSSKGVTIEDSHFFDSARKPVTEYDRYAVVFRRGEEVSEDITIRRNNIRDLQIEVNHSRRVRIDRNRSVDAVKTTAIGGFTVSDGAIMEDYEVTRNTVIDPYQFGFTFSLDPPNNSNNVFRRITIKDNVVRRTKKGNYEFIVGTGNISQATNGNVFEDIQIVGNRVIVEDSAPDGSQVTSVFGTSSPQANFFLDRLVIKDNVFQLNGKLRSGMPVIDVRRARNSKVVDNVIIQSEGRVSVSGDGNEVARNTVRDSPSTTPRRGR